MDSPITRPITESDVYPGFWTDWSHGRIRGATLTLSNRDGGFLITFLAIFVVIVGTSFWRTACFVIHYTLSSDTPKDGIYHQRQAILGNAASGASGLLSLLQMNWAWRKHTQAQPYRRILPLFGFATLTLGAFSVAGVFSSRISTSIGDKVLLSGRDCRFLLRENIDYDTEYATIKPYLQQRKASAATYAQRCYTNREVSQDCSIFLQPKLSWNRTDVGCPFPGGDKICRRSSKNLRLDTGYIDSNLDLGINTPPEHRFQFRIMAEYAPLKTEGYSENVTVSYRNNPPEQLMQYYYWGNIFSIYKYNATYEYYAHPPGTALAGALNLDYTIK